MGDMIDFQKQLDSAEKNIISEIKKLHLDFV